VFEVYTYTCLQIDFIPYWSSMKSTLQEAQTELCPFYQISSPLEHS